MRSQLYRLAEVAEHPKTTIQVIRSGGATRACWRTSWRVDDEQRLVYVVTEAEIIILAARYHY